MANKEILDLTAATPALADSFEFQVAAGGAGSSKRSTGTALQGTLVTSGAVVAALGYTPANAATAAPGGSNTQVQFNDSGAFGGDPGFVYNKTTNLLTLSDAASVGTESSLPAVLQSWTNFGAGTYGVAIAAPAKVGLSVEASSGSGIGLGIYSVAGTNDGGGCTGIESDVVGFGSAAASGITAFSASVTTKNTAAISVGVGLDVASVNVVGGGSVGTMYGVRVQDQISAGVNYSCWFGAGLYHFDALTASSLVLTNASKNLTSVALPGSASVFLDGTGAFSTPAGAGTVTHTGNLTANALVLGNAVADVTALGSLGTATTVLHGNASGPPTFGAVDLAADTTGVLPFLIDPRKTTTEAVTSASSGELVTFNNASAVAASIANATGGLGDGFMCMLKNLGAGLVTLTATTATIDGAATLLIPQGASFLLYSKGGNYFTMSFESENQKIGQVSLAVGDGVNALAANAQSFVFPCEFSGTIIGWGITADAGTCTAKFCRKATGTAIPTISDSINTSGVQLTTGTAVRSSTVSDFTSVAVAAGDFFIVILTAVSGMKNAVCTLRIRKN